jgi:hypothetical protein
VEEEGVIGITDSTDRWVLPARHSACRARQPPQRLEHRSDATDSTAFSSLSRRRMSAIRAQGSRRVPLLPFRYKSDAHLSPARIRALLREKSSFFAREDVPCCGPGMCRSVPRLAHQTCSASSTLSITRAAALVHAARRGLPANLFRRGPGALCAFRTRSVLRPQTLNGALNVEAAGASRHRRRPRPPHPL